MPFIKKNNYHLLFKSWKKGQKVFKDKFKIPTPLHGRFVTPNVMLVPLLAFDKNKNRLGYGGGYYDKSIYILKKHFQKEKKFFITIGLAYSIQEEKKIPIEKHDMRLDYIITENEVLSNFN